MAAPLAGDVPAGTLIDALARALERGPERLMLQTLDDPHAALTRRAYAERAGRLAAGLRALGLSPRPRVGLLLGNELTFFVADMAVLLLGGVPVSLYQTASIDQIEHMVTDAGLSALFLRRASLGVVMASSVITDALQMIIVVDASDSADLPDLATTRLLALPDVLAAGDRPLTLDEGRSLSKSGDLLTIVYTAGTTGPSKGVLLTHRNLVAAARAVGSAMRMSEGGRVISWLPTAHVADRLLAYYCPIVFGLEVTVCPEVKRLQEHIQAVRPTYFWAVPRVWEKMKATVEADLAARTDDAAVSERAALAASIRRVQLFGPGHPPGLPGTGEATGLFAGLRGRLGLDQAKALVTGTAPTPFHTLEFFAAIGLPIGEMYGSTETCACGTVAVPGEIRLGSAGRATPGMELQLAADGEVMLRVEQVMQGYHNLPDKTAQVITPDRWYLTGDLGRLDDDKFLWIIGRKKELIISASGKNMSPVNIESAIKSSHPLIGQVCVIGEGKPYNTALVVLDPDYARAWARRHRIDAAFDDLPTLTSIRAEVAEAVSAANARLSRVEQVKRFTILPGDWLPGGDELTPTMKLRRSVIAQKYVDLIIDLYVRNPSSFPPPVDVPFR